MDYLLWELDRYFPEVLDLLETTTSVREASDAVLLDFERPASVNDAKKLQETKDRRAALAQEFYDRFAKKEGGMKLLECILTASDCYKARQTINQTFYPKEVAGVTTGTTVTPQSTYNPLPACSCDCGN